jgi:hypothetical protein
MKQSKLFSLIKSMNRYEKGYFKKISKLYSNNGSHYIKLFEAIDKQEVYNEEKLLKKFKNASFYKHFHVTKNYLFNSIVTSLKNYKSEKSLKNQIEESKKEVEILIERFLFEDADRLLQKTKKKALETEYFEILLLLLKEEHFMCSVHETHKKNRKN